MWLRPRPSHRTYPANCSIHIVPYVSYLLAHSLCSRRFHSMPPSHTAVRLNSSLDWFMVKNGAAFPLNTNGAAFLLNTNGAAFPCSRTPAEHMLCLHIISREHRCELVIPLMAWKCGLGGFISRRRVTRHDSVPQSGNMQVYSDGSVPLHGVPLVRYNAGIRGKCWFWGEFPFPVPFPELA